MKTLKEALNEGMTNPFKTRLEKALDSIAFRELYDVATPKGTYKVMPSVQLLFDQTSDEDGNTYFHIDYVTYDGDRKNIGELWYDENRKIEYVIYDNYVLYAVISVVDAINNGKIELKDGQMRFTKNITLEVQSMTWTRNRWDGYLVDVYSLYTHYGSIRVEDGKAVY